VKTAKSPGNPCRRRATSGGQSALLGKWMQIQGSDQEKRERRNRLMAIWPAFGLAMFAFILGVKVQSAPGGKRMDESRFTVKHVRLAADKPFAEVKLAIEARLGKFDSETYKSLNDGSSPEQIRAKLETMVGTSGFVLFTTHDHGALLRIVDRPRKAIQYIVGNPLFAVEMTRYAIGAALYAPLRVLIYQDDNGKTCIEYDLPSSLFGQFGDEKVNAMAVSLDNKLGDLATAALR
jgi:uncharacterized protein (DUF302 family)